MIIQNLFVELSLIILIAVVITFVTRLLKQPLIIGYILKLILVSPYFLNLMSSGENISTLATFGVALLLFMVGINLNPKIIKDIGKVALLTGIGQIIFTFSIGFVIAKLFGFPTIISAYIAIALSFSSTIIIMKLLSDKGETESLYGRIAIGFLIVQDLVAILIIMIISSLSTPYLSFSSLAINALLKGVFLITVVFLIGIYLLPALTKFAAKSQELLLLFSLGWCLAVSSLFYYFEFSIEIGALLAGITLSLSPFRFEISSRMRPLRDFFLLLFFIVLGSQMYFANVTDYVFPIIVFSGFVLLGNPIIVMTLMGRLNYARRNSFLSGLTVAQISEFSFIIVLLGIKLGHLEPLSKEILSLITIVGLITIAGSTYLIIYANKIYEFFSPLLKLFERTGKKIDETKFNKKKDYDIILFGYNRIGYDLINSFEKIKKDYLIVDFNPDTMAQLVKQNIDCVYGDASDTELLDELNLKSAKMVISTVPEFDTNILLLKKVKKENPKVIFIAVSHQIEEATKLYRAGATYVITPHFLGGHHTSRLIESYGISLRKFLHEGNHHLKKLKERRQRGHEHPRHERNSL